MATIFYTASSLDGFIATEDDSVDWLDALPQPQEDTYTPFLANVGAICMGSSTYRFLLRHVETGEKWPYTKPTWVFTTQDLPVPEGADVRFARGDVRPVHAEMTAAGGDVWVCGGGDLAGQFLDADLLDEIVVTLASRSLGAGKPLMPRDATWTLTSARMLGDGFAELRFVPRRDAA